MRKLIIEKFMNTVARGWISTADMEADGEKFMIEHGIDPEDREKLMKMEYRHFYDMGVRPELMLMYAVALRMSPQDYLESVRGPMEARHG